MATNRGRSVSYTIAHLQHYAAGDCPRVRRLSLLRLSPNGLCVVALLLGAMPAPARAPDLSPYLPDAKLTPGATNPGITQANIGKTICNNHGGHWTTKKIRPPAICTPTTSRW